MRVLTLVLLVCSILPSCSGYGAKYREAEIPGITAGDLWDEVLRFTANRYTPDVLETDTGRRIFMSRWSGVAVAFRGRNGRRRFFAQVVPGRKTPWMVQYYCEAQHITDFAKNMNPEEEDWEFAGQDVNREKEFAWVMGRLRQRMEKQAGESEKTDANR